MNRRDFFKVTVSLLLGALFVRKALPAQAQRPPATWADRIVPLVRCGGCEEFHPQRIAHVFENLSMAIVRCEGCGTALNVTEEAVEDLGLRVVEVEGHGRYLGSAGLHFDEPRLPKRIVLDYALPEGP